MSDALPKRPQVSKRRIKTSKRSKAKDVGRTSGGIGERAGPVVREVVSEVSGLHVQSGMGSSEIHGRCSEGQDRQVLGDCEALHQAEGDEGRGSGSEPKPVESSASNDSDLEIEQFAARESLRHPVAFIEWLFESRLDPWQQKLAVEFARGGRNAAVCANGVGKTKLISGLVLWVLAVLEESKVVCTAGVFRQCQVMADYVQTVKHKLQGWTFKEQEIISPDGCKAIWYSADNPGLFEGHHAKNLALFIDECKSVDNSIFMAAERLQANRIMYASSPGGASGHFYDCFTRWRDKYKTHHVTSFDSRFVDRGWIKEQEEMYGLESDLYKSAVLAEFVSSDERCLIQLSWVNRILQNPPRYDVGETVAGIDLATTKDGDESVMVIRKGNKIEKVIAWHDDDPMRIGGTCMRHLTENNVPKSNVFADAGGVGSGIISHMQHVGWPVNAIQFGGSPMVKSERIQNRMTELWDNMANHIMLQKIILPQDDVLINQLTTRKMNILPSGKLKLESKGEMKKRGCKSPDRADALALALLSANINVKFQQAVYSGEDYNYEREGSGSSGSFDLGN